VSEIRSLVANTIVWSIVVAVVKIIGDADLHVGQVGKNGPLAQFGGRSRVQGRSQRSGHRRLDGFLLLADSFWVDIERLGGGLDRATWRGQAQGFRAEGRVVRAALSRFCRVSLMTKEGYHPMLSKCTRLPQTSQTHEKSPSPETTAV